MLARVGAAVLAPAVLVGCSGSPHSRPRPSRTAAASASPSHTGPVFTPYEKACRGGRPFDSQNPPYAGAGPHRVIGFQLKDFDQKHYIAPDPPELPKRWASQRPESTLEPKVFGAFGGGNYTRAQLALCMSPPRITGNKVGTCRYTDAYLPGGPGSPIDEISAYYEFKVFELRTGRLVESFGIDGQGSYCPAQIGRVDSAKIAQGFDSHVLEARLRGPVEGDVEGKARTHH